MSFTQRADFCDSFFKLINYPRYHTETWIFNSHLWSAFSHLDASVAIVWSKNRAEGKAHLPGGGSSLMTNVASYYPFLTCFLWSKCRVTFAVGCFSISLIYLHWDSKKKQNKINFLTLSLDITALMLSLYYNFHGASSGTDHSQEENREIFFLQMTNICLMLSTGLPCENFTFY